MSYCENKRVKTKYITLKHTMRLQSPQFNEPKALRSIFTSLRDRIVEKLLLSSCAFILYLLCNRTFPPYPTFYANISTIFLFLLLFRLNRLIHSTVSRSKQLLILLSTSLSKIFFFPTSPFCLIRYLQI